MQVFICIKCVYTDILSHTTHFILDGKKKLLCMTTKNENLWPTKFCKIFLQKLSNVLSWEILKKKVTVMVCKCISCIFLFVDGRACYG